MKKNLNRLGEEESQSKMERSSPQRLRRKNVLAKSESFAEPCRRDRVLNRNIVNRGTQIPKLKSKLGSESYSARIIQKKVKKRISRTEKNLLEQIGSQKVQRCDRSTQTLDTIFPPPPYQPSVVYCGPGGVYCGPASIVNADKMPPVKISLSESPTRRNVESAILSKNN